MNVPRAATIRYPYGYPVGPAFQPELQKEILTKCLELIYEIKEPGTVVKLPYRWGGSKGNEKGKSADPRTQEIMNHLDEILSLIKGIEADMVAYQEEENQKPEPSKYKINFYKSQVARTTQLTQILENEVLFLTNGLRNLSGPIKYLHDEE